MAKKPQDWPDRFGAAASAFGDVVSAKDQVPSETSHMTNYCEGCIEKLNKYIRDNSQGNKVAEAKELIAQYEKMLKDYNNAAKHAKQDVPQLMQKLIVEHLIKLDVGKQMLGDKAESQEFLDSIITRKELLKELQKQNKDLEINDVTLEMQQKYVIQKILEELITTKRSEDRLFPYNADAVATALFNKFIRPDKDDNATVMIDRAEKVISHKIDELKLEKVKDRDDFANKNPEVMFLLANPENNGRILLKLTSVLGAKKVSNDFQDDLNSIKEALGEKSSSGALWEQKAAKNILSKIKTAFPEGIVGKDEDVKQALKAKKELRTFIEQANLVDYRTPTTVLSEIRLNSVGQGSSSRSSSIGSTTSSLTSIRGSRKSGWRQP
jgi:BMFP domain-containing protein YqiC